MLPATPITETDYYNQFQTALFIAVEQLGVKQAFLAETCGISAGYLSKLRGWNLDAASGALTKRQHMTNTNFKIYAQPLLRVLSAQQQPVEFKNGLFVQDLPNGARTWGALVLQDSVTIKPVTAGVLTNLDGIEFPSEGELNIEWGFDFKTDPESLQKAVELLHKLALHAQCKVNIQVKLPSPAPVPQKTLEQSRSAAPPPATIGIPDTQPDGTSKDPVTKKTSRWQHLSLKPGEEHDTRLETAPHLGAMEHISIRDNRRNLQMEQFSELLGQNLFAVQQTFTPQNNKLERGEHRYLLSKFGYGRRPFVIHAELEFQGYDTGVANAGFVIGWQPDSQPPVYYHLLLTGEQMVLEKIGHRSGNAFDDFEHLNAGAPFKIADGVGYNFLLHVAPGMLQVVVNQQPVYQTPLPAEAIGYVGLRPWRSQVICHFFEIRELP